jgi:DNA-dependent RNA polymerase auxiliary subunit epsilon
MELVIDLDNLKKSNIFVEEYLYLQLIHEGLNPLDFNWSFGSGIIADLDLLEQNLWIKKVDEGYILRDKGRQLFESSTSTITFDEFWENYHRITGLSKTDKEAAKTKWKRLSNKERNKANENIQAYYDSLNDKKYCRKARTYLENKNFNDEFINSVSQRRVVAR